jgi:TRAP-type C4-dicarboxylate transport system substrate-binding protein
MFSQLRATCVAAGVLVLSTHTVTQAEELSVATFVPPNHETNEVMFKWFGEEIERRSGGSLTMKLYPAGQLGAGPTQQYKRAVEGVGDITLGVAAYTPTLFPKTMLAILPGRANTAAESTDRIWRVFDEYMADEWSEVKVLAVGSVAGSIFVGNRDISTMEGLKGAKLVPFAPSTSPVIEALGAVPVMMEITDMYTALDTGTVDVLTTSFNSLMPPWNLEDVATHVAENVPASFQVLFVAMNKERYEGLSDEHRAIIDEVAGLPMSQMMAKSFDSADEIFLNMKDGADLKYEWKVVSDAERAKMDAAVRLGMEEVYADYAARGVSNAKEIYEAMND